MCNISGYIGNRRAAPILIEMMRNQEGYCAGYYTGITTLHEGKLYTRKVLGDVNRLLSETDALNLPGTVGIIHSRSNSGGDVRWGHPFVTEDGKLSVVLNGASGKYGTENKIEDAAKMLNRLGVHFDTECAPTERIKKYPSLDNGNRVHTSEVLCQLAYHRMKEGNLPTYLGLERAFLEVPKEVVVLALNADEAGAISYAKMNMPMAIARTEDEVFLSSFSICFPTDREYINLDELPQESSGRITLDSTEIHRFTSPVSMGRLTPTVMHDAYGIILKILKDAGVVRIGKFNNAVRGLWGDCIDLRYLATYAILRDLYDMGKIKIVRELVRGPVEANDPDMYVPAFGFALADFVNENGQNGSNDDGGQHVDTV